MTLVATLAITVSHARAAVDEIAYIAKDRNSIHMVQADGAGDRQLVAAADLGSLAWAPDGRLLAYTTLATTSGGAQRIYLYDLSTGGTSELKSSMGTIGPVAFFPDGKRLISSSDKHHNPSECTGQTVVIELATGKAGPLVTGAGCLLVSLQVAPDSAALIASSCTGAPACNVLNVSLASGKTTSITEPSDDLPFSASGVVAPDNQTLAYIAHHSFDAQAGSTDLVLADRDGSNPRVLWQGQFGTVAFAPDGTQLVITQLEDSRSDAEAPEGIWVLGVNGDNPRRVAAGREPAWRPGAQEGNGGSVAVTQSPIVSAPQAGAAASGGRPAPALTSDALKNATYRSWVGGLGAGRTVQLVNGAYQAPAGSDGFAVMPYGQSGLAAFGDLDNDGSDDAAAIMDESVGENGNNVNVTLAAFLKRDGQTSGTASIAVGDRTTAMKLLAIQSGSISLSGLEVQPGDALCCPTKPFRRVFTVQGDQLVEGAPAQAAAPSPPGAAAAMEPDREPPAAVARPDASAQGFPETLTDGQRADILSAVDRANAAWATASQTLDSSGLGAGVAGQELTDDLAELDKLRGQGQTRKNINTAFAVAGVTLDAPGHAIVRTHETWFAETYEATGGRLLRRTPSATYDETYTVEYLSGSWIVTKNDI
jgi:hypothetical protein